NASDDVIEEGDETPRTDDLDCFKAFAGVLLSGGQFALVEKYPAACAAGDELAACLSYPCHQVDGGVAVVERFVKAQAVHMRDGAHRKIGDLGQRQFVCARQGDAMIEALVSLMNSSGQKMRVAQPSERTCFVLYGFAFPRELPCRFVFG